MDSRLRGNDEAGDRAVIPAEAGIHRCSPFACDRTPDTSTSAGLAVIPAKPGIHAASTEAECPVRVSRGTRGSERVADTGVQPGDDEVGDQGDDHVERDGHQHRALHHGKFRASTMS